MKTKRGEMPWTEVDAWRMDLHRDPAQRDASDSLDQAWQRGPQDVLQVLDRSQMRYGIEASPRVAGPTDGVTAAGPDWDVLVLGKDTLEFAEVKSGAIPKDDRLAFWRRLRKELADRSSGTSAVVPVLVADPGTAGDLTKWEGLAAAASAFSGSPPSSEPTNNVLTSAQLLDEALWSLCRPDASQDSSDPAVAIPVARDALGRFELHRHEARQLEVDVSQLIELLFPGGLDETQQTLLLGWLQRRATTPSSVRRLFTIRELLAEIGVLEHAVSLKGGTLKAWRDLWNQVPQRVLARTRLHLQLGKAGESFEAARVQPAALEALVSGKSHSIVILGQGGAGKSTFLAQAAQAATQRGDIVLHCGAGDVSAEELEELIKAFRFRAAIMAIAKPGALVCLLVDALDEPSNPDCRRRWAQLLSRLGSLEDVRVVASMREADWRSDFEVRKHLESWPTLRMEEWPEELVRQILSATPHGGVLSASSVGLLRTPIFLDLFWRTFVEGDAASVPRARRIRTRHSLLAAFWQERLLARHAPLPGIAIRLNGVFGRAASEIGGFRETGMDSDVVRILLSESVLVREGRLQPRLQFRHPVLRDFALAQWCLEDSSPEKVAERWMAIRGGLQRHRVLRALFEALLDPDSHEEYPSLTAAGVLQSLLRTNASSATDLAQLLGTQVPSPELDPGAWPAPLQQALPSTFAREVLAAARCQGNIAWAEPLAGWPDDCAWYDDDFPREAWEFAEFISGQAKTNPSDAIIHERRRQAARKLRSLSEHARFTEAFNRYNRHLMGLAISTVVPALPEDSTVGWLEREVARGAWRTRVAILEVLVCLVKVAPQRAAQLYQQAVGLTSADGKPVVDDRTWGALMDHQAIEWSLAGGDGRRGLLGENPAVFLPVALDLAEALSGSHLRAHEESVQRISRFLPKVPGAPRPEPEGGPAPSRLGDLVDDRPDWTFWRSLSPGSRYQRCLKAIHSCVRMMASDRPDVFLREAVPSLRRSRLAAVQSILLDEALRGQSQPGFLEVAIERLQDGRLYHVEGLLHWIERGIMICWPRLNADQKAQILANIEDVVASPHLDGPSVQMRLLVPSEGIVLQALHVIEKDDKCPFPAEVRRRWWETLRPLLRDITTEGGTPDVHMLLFDLRDGKFNDVAKPEEVFDFVECVLNRLEVAVGSEKLDLDAVRTEREENCSWRECVGYAAQCLDSLRRDQVLRTDLQKEQVHGLLSRLAGMPFRAPGAIEALHRLQSE